MAIDNISAPKIYGGGESAVRAATGMRRLLITRTWKRRSRMRSNI